MNRKNVCLATIDENAHCLAKEWGLSLELSEFCTAWNMDEKLPETMEALAVKTSCAPVRVLHAPFNELFPCAIDPKARELAKSRYLQAMKLAQEYGADRLVIHGGYNHWIYFPVWYTEQSIPFWKDFLKYIPDGMTVCLENVLEEQPEMLAEILKAVNDPRVGMCLDIGHAHAYSKVDVMKWLEICGPYIRHFHIHNNDKSWDTHSPLPEGTIPMEELLRTAERICENVTYTLELTDSESSLRWLEERGLL